MTVGLVECNRTDNELLGLSPDGTLDLPTMECPSDQVHISGTTGPWGDEASANTGQASVWSCDSDDPAIRGVRIGPVTTWPTKWSEFDLFDLSFLFSPGEHFQSYVGSPVGANGELLGFPPLHVHHIHFMKFNASLAGQDMSGAALGGVLDDVHFFNTHGDFPSGEDYGRGATSSRAYERVVPDGYGLAIENGKAFQLRALIDDVRMPNETASTFDFYLELVFTMVPANVKNVSYFWLHNPGAEQMMYQTPNYPSMAWWTITMPASGKLIPGGIWVHEHRMRSSKYGMVAVRGSREKLNFTCAAYGISDVMVEWDSARRVTSRVESLDAAYDKLISEHGDSVICRTDPDTPQFLQVNDSAMPGIAAGSRYDRSGKLLCNDWAFEEDEQVTIFAFHDAIELANAPWYPMHSVFHMYAELADGSMMDGPVWGDGFNLGCEDSGEASRKASTKRKGDPSQRTLAATYPW